MWRNVDGDHDGQRQLVHLLATHSGLQRVELNHNNLSDGGMFADALLLRSQPLAILDLSDNPLPLEDVAAIRWASERRYVNQFDTVDEQTTQMFSFSRLAVPGPGAMEPLPIMNSQSE